MKDKALLYGAGGHAKVIIDILEKEGRYEIAGIIDDNSKLQGKHLQGYKIIGGFEVLLSSDYQGCKLIIAIGENRVRKGLYERVKVLGYEFASAVHPSAQIAKDVSLGCGTVVMANAAINPGAVIGKQVIINTGATIDHDCVLGDFVHISPGAHLAGNVTVGELTHIGIGASVVPGVKIGRNSIIGAGAVVIDDIPDNVTAVGVPARVIKEHGGGG